MWNYPWTLWTDLNPWWQGFARGNPKTERSNQSGSPQICINLSCEDAPRHPCKLWAQLYCFSLSIQNNFHELKKRNLFASRLFLSKILPSTLPSYVSDFLELYVVGVLWFQSRRMRPMLLPTFWWFDEYLECKPTGGSITNKVCNSIMNGVRFWIPMSTALEGVSEFENIVKHGSHAIRG